MTADPFTRPTATPRRLLPWVVELWSTSPASVRAYLPGAPLPPRTRERVVLAVTEENGCPFGAWVHGAWRDYLGDVGEADAEPLLLAHARACAQAGRPLPTDHLREVLPAEVVSAVRATVARAELANLLGNTAEGVLGRLTGRRPLAPWALARELTLLGMAAPWALPALGAAAAMRAVARLAPPMPALELADPAEANLLAHLLGEAVPTYLAHAAVRTAVGLSPFTLVVGIRSGRTAATVRVGRGEVAIENGIAPDVAVVIEGDVEPLLRHASGSLVRELGALRLRGS